MSKRGMKNPSSLAPVAASASAISARCVVSVGRVNALSAIVGNSARMSFGAWNDIIQNVVPESVFLRKGESDERSERADSQYLFSGNDGVFARKHFSQLTRHSGEFSFALHRKRGLIIFPGKDSTLYRHVNQKKPSEYTEGWENSYFWRSVRLAMSVMMPEARTVKSEPAIISPVILFRFPYANIGRPTSMDVSIP
ncbi:MAG: hypothetical protein QG650_134 [Patescibacteria group bacterium]|nr:hypothetical protein [Patescibacteria group bacterium]